MITNYLIDIIGWTGSVALVCAYALVSNGWLESRSKIYQALNLVGGICLIINTVHYGAYPSTFVNVVWSIIAISALSKVGRSFPSNTDRGLSMNAVKK